MIARKRKEVEMEMDDVNALIKRATRADAERERVRGSGEERSS